MSKKQTEKTKKIVSREKPLSTLIDEAELICSKKYLDFNQTMKLNKIRQLIQTNVLSVLSNLLLTLDKVNNQPEPTQYLEGEVRESILLEELDNLELSPYMQFAMQWIYDNIIMKRRSMLTDEEGVETEMFIFKNKYKGIFLANQSNRFLISEILPHLTDAMILSISNFARFWRENASHLNFYDFIKEAPEDDQTEDFRRYVNNLTLKFLRNRVMDPDLLDTFNELIFPVFVLPDDEYSSDIIEVQEGLGLDNLSIKPFGKFEDELQGIINYRVSNLNSDITKEIITVFNSNKLILENIQRMLKGLEKSLKQVPEINEQIEAYIQLAEDDFLDLITDSKQQEDLFDSIKNRFIVSLFEVSVIDEVAIKKVIEDLKLVEISYDQISILIMSKTKGPKELDLIRGISRFQLLLLIDVIETRLNESVKDKDKTKIQTADKLEFNSQYHQELENTNVNDGLSKQDTDDNEVQQMISFDSSSVVNYDVLAFTNVQKIIRDLNNQLNLASKIAKKRNSKSILDTFLTIITNPTLANLQIFLPRSKVKRFSGNSTNGIMKDDLEIDLNAKDRIFLREEEGVIKVVFLGNPDYH